MASLIFYKLLAIFLAALLGWVAGRMRWLGDERSGADPSRVLSNLAFFLFVPALLFRTTARLDFGALPWRTLAGFFVPVVVALLLVYVWQRWQQRRSAQPEAAVPAVRALAASFGNAVQIGVPIAAALYGEAGLGIHVTIISLHALIVLSLATALVELDLAHARARHEGGASLLRTLRSTARNTVIHPVVLPVLAGMAWNFTGLALPAAVDEVLVLLGSAVAPVCLVLLGVSLAYSGVHGRVRGALELSLIKLVLLPAVALAFAWWVLGLRGVPLGVVVMAAALPIGSNPLIFAQRYATLEGEATASIVISTLGFVALAPLWLALLELLK